MMSTDPNQIQTVCFHPIVSTPYTMKNKQMKEPQELTRNAWNSTMMTNIHSTASFS
jgi:hypothetical protein